MKAFGALFHVAAFHLAGKLLLGGAGMQAQVVKHCEVGLEYGHTTAKLHSLVGEAQMVLFAFDPKGLASLRDLMAVVRELNGLFEADGLRGAMADWEDFGASL
jgi:hypothetical protein